MQNFRPHSRHLRPTDSVFAFYQDPQVIHVPIKVNTHFLEYFGGSLTLPFPNHPLSVNTLFLFQTNYHNQLYKSSSYPALLVPSIIGLKGIKSICVCARACAHTWRRVKRNGDGEREMTQGCSQVGKGPICKLRVWTLFLRQQRTMKSC